MIETERLFNFVSIAIGVVGGFMCNWLGGCDVILNALVALVILDYITGVLKAISTKTLSSAVGFKGLIRKAVIFIVIASSVVVQQVIGDALPIREMTILFFLSNEGISLLENASAFVPIPDKLKETLIQIRDKEV